MLRKKKIKKKKYAQTTAASDMFLYNITAVS